MAPGALPAQAHLHPPAAVAVKRAKALHHGTQTPAAADRSRAASSTACSLTRSRATRRSRRSRSTNRCFGRLPRLPRHLALLPDGRGALLLPDHCESHAVLRHRRRRPAARRRRRSAPILLRQRQRQAALQGQAVGAAKGRRELGPAGQMGSRCSGGGGSSGRQLALAVGRAGVHARGLRRRGQVQQAEVTPTGGYRLSALVSSHITAHTQPVPQVSIVGLPPAHAAPCAPNLPVQGPGAWGRAAPQTAAWGASPAWFRQCRRLPWCWAGRAAVQAATACAWEGRSVGAQVREGGWEGRQRAGVHIWARGGGGRAQALVVQHHCSRACASLRRSCREESAPDTTQRCLALLATLVPTA